MNSKPSGQVSLKERRRNDYRHFLSYRTRWSDNDQYSHVNNSVYYHLFDSIVNAYLISHCELSPQTSGSIGLVISSHCQFFSPLSFPEVLDLGLRVNHLGKSSVTYEHEPAAVGGYTHVFVDAVSRKTSQIGEQTREGLQRLFVSPESGPGSKL
ncbi:thioesterase thiol ester dehydrase-isomerase [Lactarius indigo]|nr:thioesterase thiol ester dehydrase-isomerase [Lactarius indigo]